jgi:hypothetical protein
MTVAQTRAKRRQLIREYQPKGKAAEQQKEANRASKAGKKMKGK